jgi:maltoporin
MSTPRILSLAIATALMISAPVAFADTLSEQNAAEIAELKQLLQQQTNKQEKLEARNDKESTVDFNGYMRGGFSSNGGGTSSGDTKLAAPHAPGFYRLGAGETNYAAWNLNKKFTVESGAWAKVYTGLVYEDTDARRWVYNNKDKTVFLDKIYAEMGGLDFAPDLTFWAGRVNFGWDIHILDRKYYEIRSTGAGFKGMKVGDGELNMYLLSNNTDDDDKYTDSSNNEITYDGNSRPNTHTIGGDYKIGNWWIAASAQTNSNDGTFLIEDKTFVTTSYTGDSATTGAHLMVQYTQQDYFGFAKGRTKYVGQYATGLNAAVLGRNGDTGQPNEDAQSYRFFFDGLAQLDRLDINTVAVVQKDIDVSYDGQEKTWISIGGRASYYVTDNFAMQFEVGHDWTEYKNDNDRELGSMTKLTIAPTLKLKSAFFSRPELRLFATYATFSGDYTAEGIDGYDSDDENVFIFGAQAEMWF